MIHIFRISITILCALGLVGGWNPANGAAERISVDALSWYTPDSKFQPIEPAPWVYEGVQKAFITSLEDPKTLPFIDELAKIGVTVIHTAGPDPYYPLRSVDPNSGEDPAKRDYLMRAFDRMRKNGMRVVIGVSPYSPVALVKQHPEWRLKHSPDAPPLDPNTDFTKFDNNGLRSMSLVTPYGDWLIECLAEIFKDYKVDGISFDGNYHPMINFTPYEVELFEKETGRKFPAKIDLDDPTYKVYLLWADTKLENWYRKAHERLRQVNPQAAVYTWTTNAGRFGHFLTSPRVMSARMNMLFDSPVQEWWLDEVNHGATVVPAFGAAYVRALTLGRTGASEPYLLSRGNPYSGSSFPTHEVTVRAMMALTNGSITPLMIPNNVEKDFREATMVEIGKRKKWFVHTKQEPWAALLVSEQTRQFYAKNQVMDRFLAHPLGVFRVGWEEHLPINLITDWDIRPERLKPYKVLVLPNAAALSDRQVRVIRAYVAGGGGLIATCETSLFDELGQPRANFALADVFGVDYLGRPSAPTTREAMDVNAAILADDAYWAKRAGAAEMRWSSGDIQTDVLVSSPRVKALIPGVQASFKGPMVLMSEPKPPMKKAMVMFPNPVGVTPIPAMAAGEYQKGRVVYMAAGFDAANFSYGYPYQRVVMAEALKWAARETPPIDVQAPMCIQSTFWRQKDAQGERLVVHLFNGINTTSGHGLAEVEVPLREEVIPVSGIKVRFRGIIPKRVHVEPEGKQLKVTKTGEWAQVTVPAVAVHSMVVAELGP